MTIPTVRQILCASDLSPASEPAWVTAQRLGRLFRADVLLLHVIPSVPMPMADPAERPAIEPEDDAVHAALVAAGVQVAVAPWPRDPHGEPWRRLIRFSCPPYVDAGDLDRLVEALTALRVAA